MNLAIPDHIIGTSLERHYIGLAVVGDQLAVHYGLTGDERALEAIRHIRAALSALEAA